MIVPLIYLVPAGSDWPVTLPMPDNCTINPCSSRRLTASEAPNPMTSGTRLATNRFGLSETVCPPACAETQSEFLEIISYFIPTPSNTLHMSAIRPPFEYGNDGVTGISATADSLPYLKPAAYMRSAMLLNTLPATILP